MKIEKNWCERTKRFGAENLNNKWEHTLFSDVVDTLVYIIFCDFK